MRRIQFSRALGRQHHGTHRRVLPHCRESLGEFGNHLVVEGVAHLGAVEGDTGHMALGGDEQ